MPVVAKNTPQWSLRTAVSHLYDCRGVLPTTAAYHSWQFTSNDYYTVSVVVIALMVHCSMHCSYRVHSHTMVANGDCKQWSVVASNCFFCGRKKAVMTIMKCPFIRVRFGNNCTSLSNIVKIVRGEAEYNFYYCMYNYSKLHQNVCDSLLIIHFHGSSQ